MCNFCAMSGPPTLACRTSKQKGFRLKSTHIHWLFFFRNVLSHQMESKVKKLNLPAGRASKQAAVLSEKHSRVYGKKAWDIKNKRKPHISDFLTAFEQRHSSCTSSIHGREFLAYTFNKERHSGSTHISSFSIFQHLPSTRVCVLCWKVARWRLVNVQKTSKTHMLVKSVLTPTEHNASALRVHVGFFSLHLSSNKKRHKHPAMH